MKEIQAFLKDYQREMNWEINEESYEKSKSSLLNNYMLLTTEIAEVAEELRRNFNITEQHKLNGLNETEAFKMAKEEVKEDLGKEIADCIAYICKIANFYEIDIEESFYEKMEEVKKRRNKDI
ncbi:MazG nucleotide pyrophosphohydrolase domain-containing protein [Litchfieldia alkalitelluris]|uniref:MazG nucleotide pyrophosphohydrolase domain-containing protein n=1 Tax=Litchfieldia alkalitelluris TaxID=304268 RepID=UPI000996D5F3|nr:MazG nucleotide pyrophosphohydrolase domain-containing protein [Litchfieldia alkalitelluris]